MPLFRYAVKPTLASVFIAPLLDGIGLHDCTPFRKSTFALLRFHYSIALISSPRFDNLDTKHLLLQYGFAIPTHAESTTIQCAVTYSDMIFTIFELCETRAVGGSSQRVVKGKPLTIPINSSYRAIYIFKPLLFVRS